MGATKITVSPAKLVPTNKYKVKVQTTPFSKLPKLGDDLSSWTDWNGTSQITATNGNYIAVAETEANNTCEKVGSTKIQSLLATSTAGDYNSATETWTDGNVDFSLTQQPNNKVKVDGTLPYKIADTILGLPSGNRFSVKIKNNNITSQADLPSGIIARVTNTGVASGYNTYDKSAFESDGSLIVVLDIKNKNIPIEVKITWTAGIETTYNYDLKDVSLEEQPEIIVDTQPNQAGGETVTVETTEEVVREPNSAGGETVIIGE